MRGDWMMDGGMGIWMLVNAVFWILVIVGIVLLVVWAVRRVGGGERSKAEESALEILKKRYARGEITKEEYEEKKRDIS
ncbi:MAG TPA: SHOCT domain-containing protein [Thermodesulfobacteriota bacterium]|nr:SHOCT domain-containing protein [Thermodesulfobacteriota bacterium]